MIHTYPTGLKIMNDLETFVIKLDSLDKQFNALNDEQENYLDNVLKLNEKLADFLFMGFGWNTLRLIYNNTIKVRIT